MKVLHIGLMVNPNQKVGLSKAFRDVCDEYQEIKLDPKELTFKLETLSFKPNIVFIQIQNDKIGNHSTNALLNPYLIKLRKEGAFIINWTGDKRKNIPAWMYGFEVDLTCFSNWDDVHDFRGKSDFLQIGIDPENFNNKWQRKDFDGTQSRHIPKHPHDVVFMGNHNGQFPLSPHRMQIVRFLRAKYGADFGLYGNGYPHTTSSINAEASRPKYMQSVESYIYSTARVAINISHFNSDGYYSDRLLRMLGSGVAVLSHNFKGIERDWKVGFDLETYNNMEDFEYKLDFMLRDEDRRATLAHNGYKKVHKYFTYKNMVDNIFQLYIKHNA